VLLIVGNVFLFFSFFFFLYFYAAAFVSMNIVLQKKIPPLCCPYLPRDLQFVYIESLLTDTLLIIINIYNENVTLNTGSVAYLRVCIKYMCACSRLERS
jgi:hypothetical protein